MKFQCGKCNHLMDSAPNYCTACGVQLNDSADVKFDKKRMEKPGEAVFALNDTGYAHRRSTEPAYLHLSLPVSAFDDTWDELWNDTDRLSVFMKRAFGATQFHRGYKRRGELVWSWEVDADSIDEAKKALKSEFPRRVSKELELAVRRGRVWVG